MNNRVLQVDFKDDTSLLINSETKTLNYIDKMKNINLYELEHAASNGNKELTKRLSYTEEVLKHIWAAQGATGEIGFESPRKSNTSLN